MSYPLPEGAVPPPGGYPAGWGPPFATPRDCPAHDWNHLCPWGGPDGQVCSGGCYGLAAEHTAGKRMPGESTHAWLLRTVPRRSGSRQRDAHPVDAALAQRIKNVRSKRGIEAAVRLMLRCGYTRDAALGYLAAAHMPAYSGGSQTLKEQG